MTIDLREFTKTIDGEAALSAAGLIALAGAAAHDPDNQQARERGSHMFDALLHAAVAGGFTARDILETLFARGERSPRVSDLCRAAADCIGRERLFVAMRDAGFDVGGADHD